MSLIDWSVVSLLDWPRGCDEWLVGAAVNG